MKYRCNDKDKIQGQKTRIGIGTEQNRYKDWKHGKNNQAQRSDTTLRIKIFTGFIVDLTNNDEEICRFISKEFFASW